MLFETLNHNKILIGVVHLKPTPGSPNYSSCFEKDLLLAIEDAKSLVAGGCDAIIVENHGDKPYFGSPAPPETVASLTLAAHEIKKIAGQTPIGLNLLKNDARGALGIATVVEAAFIRINIHIGVYITDQGIIEGDSARIARDRSWLCPGLEILCDVHVKHATNLKNEALPTAIDSAFNQGIADGVIVSGAKTGQPIAKTELQKIANHKARDSLLIGSGLTEENCCSLLKEARGAIVGTSLKEKGMIENPVDLERVSRLRRVIDRIG